MDIVEIPDGGVDLAGFLEGAVKGLKLSPVEPILSIVSLTAATAARARSMAMACGVKPTPPRSASSSSFGRDRQLVDDDGLLPLI
jgi:hypothetical protein